MKLKAMAVVTTAIVFMAACKKEKDAPAFRAEGYWWGYAYLNHIALLNKSNGVGRLYYGFTGTDTASAFFKLDGTYAVSGGSLKGIYPTGSDSLILETHNSTNSTITGMLWSTTSPDVAPFSLVKQ